MLDWGLWDERLVPREQYDGILFIDEVQIPQYIENPTGEMQTQKEAVSRTLVQKEILPSSSLLKMK